MSKLVRYGRKIPMPSTIEIKHELRLMAAADALSHAATPEEIGHIVDDLAAKHGLSSERAAMLVERFGIGRQTLEGAAQDLRASRG